MYVAQNVLEENPQPVVIFEINHDKLMIETFLNIDNLDIIKDKYWQLKQEETSFPLLVETLKTHNKPLLFLNELLSKNPTFIKDFPVVRSLELLALHNSWLDKYTTKTSKEVIESFDFNITEEELENTWENYNSINFKQDQAPSELIKFKKYTVWNQHPFPNNVYQNQNHKINIITPEIIDSLKPIYKVWNSNGLDSLINKQELTKLPGHQIQSYHLEGGGKWLTFKNWCLEQLDVSEELEIWENTLSSFYELLNSTTDINSIRAQEDLKEKAQDFKKAFENILNHNDIDLEQFYLEYGIDTSINSNFESSLIKDFLETLNQNDVIRLFKKNKQQDATSVSTTLQTFLIDSSQVNYESGIEILDLFLKVGIFVLKTSIVLGKRMLEMELITIGLDNQGKLKKLCSEIIDNSSKKKFKM